MINQNKQYSDKRSYPIIDKNISQNKSSQKNQIKQENSKIADETTQQSNNFITEIPIETQKQIDKLKEKHRKRMQEQREQYQESVEQKKRQEDQNNDEEKDYILQEQKAHQLPIKYMKSDVAKKESMVIIEQGKQRRQKMIENNLNKLKNKLNQDAHKIDETIDLLRIEIVEAQLEIKQKAKIEREELQEYHSSMHKQIGDLLKMKNNILQNQQQIYISQMKSQNKRGRRSISESQIRKKDSLLEQSKIFQQKKIHQLMNQNGYDFNKVQHHKSPQKSELIHSNLEDDESLYYSDERINHQDFQEEFSQEQYTFSNKSKPLYQQMEEQYQSKIVLPEIQQRDEMLKQRREYYRKRMEPLKIFQDHEIKYEQVKESKQKERIEKIQRNQEEQKQHSLEKYTKSKTYVKTINEEIQQKENQKKKEIMRKILIEKQKYYQPSISVSDQSRMKRSQSFSEVSQTIHTNNAKIPISQIVQSNFEQMTEKERILKGIENHKADLNKKDLIFKTKETTRDPSISDLMAFNSEKQSSNEHQVLKRQKRKILTQKFHGDHSPLPDVFISDEFYSTEKKNNANLDISQDLIEVRKGPQITQFLTDVQLEQPENDHQTKSINCEMNKDYKNNNDNKLNFKNAKDKKEQNQQAQPKELQKVIIEKKQNENNSLNQKDPKLQLLPKEIPLKNTKEELIKNDFVINREQMQSENRDKTPHIQKQNTDTSKVIDQYQPKNNDINFYTPVKQINNQNEKVQSNNNQQTSAHSQAQKPQTQSNQSIQNKQLQQNTSPKNKSNNGQYQSLQNLIEGSNQKQTNHRNKLEQISQEKKELTKGVSHPSLIKNTQLPSLERIQLSSQQKGEAQQQLKSKRIQRSPEKVGALQISQEKEIHQDQKVQNSKNFKEDDGMNSDIFQLYKQYKQIKSKSKRSVSEVSNSRSGYSSQPQLPQEQKNKYKDYLHDVKEKYKLARQIDDWKKIDKNELLNNQQKIMKLSEKVQYLDNKLQHMKEITKQNKGNQFTSQFEQYDEDSILINSVQAKIAILNKLN